MDFLGIEVGQSGIRYNDMVAKQDLVAKREIFFVAKSDGVISVCGDINNTPIMIH